MKEEERKEVGGGGGVVGAVDGVCTVEAVV